MQKLYCYVDETGQDARSKLFIVVALVSDKIQDLLRERLLKIERIAKTGRKKWRKLRSEYRLRYIQELLTQGIGCGETFFGIYKKPLPYFLPLLETIEKSIRQKAQGAYRTIITVDGIDKKKAAELTGALRLREITLEFVRSARDESEPLLRLTDMWSGCIRAATERPDGKEAKVMVQAVTQGYLTQVK